MTDLSRSATRVPAPIKAVGDALSRVMMAVFLLSLMLLLASALVVGPLVYQLRVKLSQHSTQSSVVRR